MKSAWRFERSIDQAYVGRSCCDIEDGPLTYCSARDIYQLTNEVGWNRGLQQQYATQRTSCWADDTWIERMLYDGVWLDLR